MPLLCSPLQKLCKKSDSINDTPTIKTSIGKFMRNEKSKNIIGNLVTLSIPKVAKNGQKVPIWANFEISLIIFDFCASMKSLL